MDTLEYVRLVNQAPIRYLGTEVSIEEFATDLRNAIRALSRLSEINRLLFDNSKIERKGFFNNCADVPAKIGNYDNSAKMISAILNIARSCEHLLAEFEFCTKGHEFDSPAINVSCMRLFQSLAVISEQIGRSFEEIQISNIECLKFEHPAYYKPRTQQKEVTLMDLVDHE